MTSMLGNKSQWILIRLVVALSIIALTALIYFQSNSLNYALELGAVLGAIAIVILAVIKKRR
ncbi:MAG: hypothetical protein P8Y18_09165 [Candidatus Bathyarchaeota archaeon]